MRLVLCRSERPATIDLQDASRFLAARSTDYSFPAESVSVDQGSGYGRLLELQSQQKDSRVSATRWCEVENGPTRRGSRAGISQMHRMFSVPERLPRVARSWKTRNFWRTALFRSHRGIGNASSGRSFAQQIAERRNGTRFVQHHK